jgi:hypothetical protein
LQAGQQCEIINFASGDACASVDASNPPTPQIGVRRRIRGSWERDGRPWLAGGVLACCVRSLPLKRADDSSLSRWVLMLCRWFFSAGSCKLAILMPQWHLQVMPPCHCVANAVSSWYIHCKFFATGVILMNMAFDKIGIK